MYLKKQTMNYKKNIFFFIIFLLSTISFSTWAQPYVRIEELNQAVGDYNNYPYGRIMDYYCNPTIMLYADAECTVPYTTTTDLDVTLERFVYDGYLRYPEYSYTNTSSFTVTIPSGVSSYRFFEEFTYKFATWDMRYDSNNNVESLWSTFESYSVLPESFYEAAPSVQRPYEERVEYSQWPLNSVYYRVYEPD